MKTKLSITVALISCLFLSFSMIGQEKPTEQSINSFKSAVNSIEWNEFTEFLHTDTGPCKPDLLKKLRLLPTTQVENKHYGELLKDLRVLFEKITSTLAETHGNLWSWHTNWEIEVPKEYMPDLIFLKLHESNSLEDFLEKIGTRDDGEQTQFDEDTIKDLTAIYEIYRNKIFGPKLEILYDEIPFGACTLDRALQVELFSVSAIRVVWMFRLIAYVDCDCSVKDPKELDNANVHLEIPVVMTMSNMNMNTAKFWPPKGKEARPKLKIKMIDCCGADEKDKDQSPHQGGGAGGGDGNKGGGSGSKDKDKDCCDHEQATNSIGLFPVVNFGNNFDDTTVGLAVEYLREMGSWGAGEIFAGAQGGYANSSGQGGEITENFFSGALILENRTSILPCLQWTQRVCGQYGEGTLEAFGNSDDFSQFTFGIHTGLNIDVAQNVSIGADATLFELGNQTFTPTNGPEQKTDIGNFSLGRPRIRFGVRLFF